MNDPMIRPFVGALVAALALVTAPAAAQEPPASTTQEPTVPQQAVGDDENPWALAVLIGAGVCVVVGIGGGLFAARGSVRAPSEGESARRQPHLVFARSAPGDAQAGYFSPFAQPGIRARESTESASDEQPVAPGPKRVVAGGAEAGADEMAARGETEGFAWEEPEARTAQPPTEGHAEPEAAASVMHEALSTETAIEVEPEPATEVEPVPESAAAEAEEPEQLAEEERTILSPIVEPELLVVGEPLAPPGHDVPEPEAAHTEEQEETAGARPEAAPEVQLEARADETAAEPEPEVAVLLDADDAPEDPRAVPIGMPESQRAVEEAPTPVEEEPGEPVAANKPARRARKKPVKARPKRAASKAKERVPPAQPKPSRRRPPRDPPG